jgi:hypothetical protein
MPIGARRWVVSIGVFVAIVVAVHCSEQPPHPRPLTAPSTDFSETRAFPLIRRLAALGPRVPGTAAYRQASDLLAAELRNISGVEVRVQEAEGVHAYPFIPFTVQEYRERNVLVRIRGRSSDAILLSAHFDTTGESAGAADDLLGAAAVVETMRALASGPMPARTIIANLNGDEEQLLGSTAFLHDDWFQTVRAFINLEGLPAGKTIILQAAPSLIDVYRRVAPRPYATVVAQDLFETGLLPSDSDYHVYAQQGHIPGIDLVTFHDGWALHTSRDRPERIERGSLQDMGDKMLALARALADTRETSANDVTPRVYFDVLGRLFISYSATTARGFAVGALLLACAVLVFGLKHGELTPRDVIGGTGITLGASLAGMLCALAGSLALPLVFHRPHGWFATPSLGAVTFAALAAAGVLAVHAAVRRRRSGRRQSTAAWAGSLVVWSAVLIVVTVRGGGAGYLALWSVLPSAIGLALAIQWPRLRPWCQALAFVPAAVLTLQMASLFVGMMPYAAGQIPVPISFDPIFAAVVALPAVSCLSVGMIAVCEADGIGRAAAGVAVVGLALLVVTALHFPYTAERPKRVAVLHGAEDDRASLYFGGSDSVDVRVALGKLTGLEPASGTQRAWAADASFRLAAPAPPMRAPAVEVRSSSMEGGKRRVHVRVRSSGALALLLEIPRERLAGWSLTPELPRAVAGDRRTQGRIDYVVRVQAPRDVWEAWFDVVGDAAFPARLTATNELADSDALRQAREQMPPWTEVSTEVFQLRHLTL